MSKRSGLENDANLNFEVENGSSLMPKVSFPHANGFDTEDSMERS